MINVVSRALCCLLFFCAGCRYALQEERSNDFAELVIKGDAKQAARYCDYPLRVNIGALAPKIRNEAEFVKWFPILFDTKARELLAHARKESGGWNFHNWRGEMFGDGQLWRDFESKKGTTVNEISDSLFAWWKTQYQNDLATLAPEYRKGCVWSACYFRSTDGTCYGRVDSLGEPWTIEKGVGARVSDKFRILLFKRGEKTSGRPWRVFVYDAKEDKDYSGRYYGDIESKKNKFMFWESQTTQFSADYGLAYIDENGRKIVLELDACDWPPRE